MAMKDLEIKQGTVKASLSDILLLVSWAEISHVYFGKPFSWLFHKLDGFDEKKQPSEFTEEERYKLKGALVDLADRIRRAAENI